MGDETTYEELLLMSDTDPEKPSRLSMRGNSLLRRFRRHDDIADIENAISAHARAVRLTPDRHPNKPGRLTNLGASFGFRFMRLGDVADIDKAISAQEDALRLMPDGDSGKPGCLSNLGVWFQSRFEHLGDLLDIDKAVSVQDDAIRLTPDNHPKKPGYLSNLGVSLETRFDHVGDLTDLDKAISVYDDAVQLTPEGHPVRPTCLSSLGSSLQNRFKRLGNVVDIDKAIPLQSDAVDLTPDGHPDKLGRLTNLGNSFLARFEHFGDISDIDKAITFQDDAVQLVPDNHPKKLEYLNNLGASFQIRFEHLGEIANIDKAISVQDDAVRLTPDNNPDKPGRLTNLAASLQTRFERLCDISDMERAISLNEKAVHLAPDNHPEKPAYMNNLGISFQARFEHLGDITDLDTAISLHEDAVRLMPVDHPDKPACLNNIGFSLRTHFEHLKDVGDIDKAIAAQDEAVRLTSKGHPQRPAYLNNLGISFQIRFEHLGDVTDLERAISAYDDAIRLMPDAHPDKPTYLHNLGLSYRARFERLGDVADIDKARLQFSAAACSSVGAALPRFRAAMKWATSALRNRHPSHLDACRRALDLIPRVAWLGLPMTEQHRELANIGSAVRDAAAVAIDSGQCETALEWLEQGRSIVWGQILHLRTPVDDLRSKDPTLADRLTQVSAQLERASSRDIGAQPSRQLSLEETGRKHRELAAEWESLVERARAVPGFEYFLRPKKLSQLRSAARSGPVVVINVHEARCDALVLVADREKVTHIPLNRFSYRRAQELHNSLERLLSNAGVRFRGDRGTEWVNMQQGGDTEFQRILSELWTRVVHPVLEGLSLPVSRAHEPPCIWWCPTGPLTFLPLHAAGLYHTDDAGAKISDFVASSYTPTLTALLDSQSAAERHNFQLLAISQPSTPGQSRLPQTKKELEHIREHAGDHPLLSLEGAEATVERVIQGMNESSWVHLACHGKQDADSPTKSTLLLQDGHLALAEIIKMSLPHAEFAFLSACQTATGDKHLTEEAVHLAAGMLLAGYHSVVATTWSIRDNDAPVIADEVYSRLFKGARPDSTKTAHALHHAVQRLRKQGASFLSWVPFIHVGL